MDLPRYAELHCLSNFTFLRGASHPEELVEEARRLGYTALGLTDECSLAGVVRAHGAAKDRGLKLVIGTEVKFLGGPRLVFLAQDREGYGRLSALITQGRRRAAKGDYRLERADIAPGLDHCLALLLPKRRLGVDELGRLKAEAGWLAGRFPERLWIAVELLREGDDAKRLESLSALSRETGIPLLAAGDVHMHVRERRALQDTLTAIRLKTTVKAAGYALYPNSERHLRRREVLARLYPSELLTETVRIAERCSFSLDELRYEYPEELVPAGETPARYLRDLTERGVQRRWPAGAPAKVRAQIEHELQLIAELGYQSYFLTVHDIVAFARRRGILCQGRGSAANSAVCYCLGITEVDPSRMEMLFERFVSKERQEPPDIDVDFEHERREEVIQYIYEKYSRERAALAATVITYRAKSAIRDAGKALGLSLDQVERLAKNIYWWDGKRLAPERLREAGFDPDNPVLARLTRLVAELVGFPRHLSQHVGGMIISRGPLAHLVPIERARARDGPCLARRGRNAAMPERTVIQWDKDDLDALGLLKVDCLCLGMLSAIRRAFELIEGFEGKKLTLATVPSEDPATYAMIQRADTLGVFQIESRAQMAMLPRLKPACYYDLVIEVAIIRPGPIQGEMVHPYLRRRHGIEPVSYPSEEVRGVLGRTLGVPLFQEQVIKLAMVAAGFSPGEADQLRRSMAAWKRMGGLQRFEQKLVEGMRARGYSERFARQIYKQIEGFGEYGFPESHAASFALLVYVSAWLKCHAPAAFTAALLNSQPLGFYAPAQLVQDARRHGVEVRPVDVGASAWDCTLERGANAQPALRLGLCLVKGLSRAAAGRLIEARAATPFRDLHDFIRRAGLPRRDLEALTQADALVNLAGQRHQAYWAVLGIEAPAPLLAAPTVQEALPLLRRPTEGEAIAADYGSLGLTLRQHPLALLRPRLERMAFVTAERILGLAHGETVRAAGLVITRQRPGTATGVVFVTLEDETGCLNLIVWSRLVDSQRKELLGSRLLGVTGEVQREGEVVHVLARKLEDHTDLLGRLSTQSRDFH
ncbi:MAG: error-prone DNA polymerase [Gammaproteobacteria bacterium]